MTAPDLLRMKVIDRVVEEPAGGAHQDYDEAARKVRAALVATLAELDSVGSANFLVEDRYRRFRAIGALRD